MDPRVKALLKENHTANSMFMSVVSIMLRTIREVSDGINPQALVDMRESVMEKLASMLEPENIDLTCWPLVREEMKYDEYLNMRRRERKLTPFDLVRPGLVEDNFTTMVEYFEHYQRVSEESKRMQSVGAASGKVCTKCGNDRPLSSFKRGAVCNTCRSRAYRERARGVTE